MGTYRDQLLPRGVDLVLRGGEYRQLRARMAAGLRGEVLEIGFGSGPRAQGYCFEGVALKA